MKLGIGVPTFNRSKLLTKCLDRLHSFTTTPHEIVVADDGSTDDTLLMLAKQPVRYITGRNMGVSWNKNRALHVLQEVLACDIAILVEDDTFASELGWEERWIKAAVKYGHVNLAGPWFKDKFLSGQGIVDDPVLSYDITGQVTAFSREALSDVGYMDTRFRGYGYGHADHSIRMVCAGYGGFIRDNRPIFYLIEGGVTVTAEESYKTQQELSANARVLAESRKELFYRQAFRTEEEFEQLRAERRAIARGTGKTPPLRTEPIALGVVCCLDDISHGVLRGWASLEPGAQRRRLRLQVIIDSRQAGIIGCDQPRPDVQDTGLELLSGYEFKLPSIFLDSQPHQLQLREQGKVVLFNYRGKSCSEVSFSASGEVR